MRLVKSGIRFNKIIFRLVSSPSFLVITIAGNAIILAASGLFYFLENGTNPQIKGFLDAVWWGFATATTVGYGDIIPVTVEGKVIGILLMLAGTAIFATFTALFAQSILEDEYLQLRMGGDKKTSEEDEFLETLKKHKLFLEKQIRHYQASKDD